MNYNEKELIAQEVVKAVLKELKCYQKINLEKAKLLIEKVEAYAKKKGKNCVISVCGPDGNMVAIHVMDDAYLASFDVAMNKSYTAVAVKMSTMDLSHIAQPGETFYGVQHTNGGRIVIFGGGIPLTLGGKIVGGLGISGGTGEEDHDIAMYGLKIFQELYEN